VTGKPARRLHCPDVRFCHARRGVGMLTVAAPSGADGTPAASPAGGGAACGARVAAYGSRLAHAASSAVRTGLADVRAAAGRAGERVSLVCLRRRPGLPQPGMSSPGRMLRLPELAVRHPRNGMDS
jgi:hypothetical protein